MTGTPEASPPASRPRHLVTLRRRSPALRGLCWAALVAALGFSCAHTGPRHPGGRTAPPPPADDAPLHPLLEADLVGMLGFREPESKRLAMTVEARTEELAAAYRVHAPAIWHNILVNVGLRERGLCCHWTQDLMQTLRTLHLHHYRVMWGVSRHGTWREHNSVVVVAAGKPFASGLVLDPWRKAGELYWVPVASDTYPWKPHPAENGAARIGCR